MLRSGSGTSGGRSAFSTFHHGVRLYKDDRGLCRHVARYLHGGLMASQPGVVVARTSHTLGILSELEALGVDVAALMAAGDLRSVDAEQALDTFLVDGRPDAALFRTMTAGFFRDANGDRRASMVHIYGEMVDVLWQSGRTEAALRLEVLWSQLAATESFSLLCGYAAGNFYRGKGLDAVCELHTHVEPSMLESVPWSSDRYRLERL